MVRPFGGFKTAEIALKREHNPFWGWSEAYIALCEFERHEL